jgi:plastocyanin
MMEKGRECRCAGWRVVLLTATLVFLWGGVTCYGVTYDGGATYDVSETLAEHVFVRDPGTIVNFSGSVPLHTIYLGYGTGAAGATLNFLDPAYANYVRVVAGTMNIFGGTVGSTGISVSEGADVTIYGTYVEMVSGSVGDGYWDADNNQLVPTDGSNGWNGDLVFKYEGEDETTTITFSTFANIKFFTAGNHAPTANAGADVTISSSDQGITTLQGTADDQDAEDALQYRWLEVLVADPLQEVVLQDWTDVVRSETPPDPAILDLSTLAAFAGGAHTLKLEVKDDAEATSSDLMVLSVFAAPEITEIAVEPTELNLITTITATFTDSDGGTHTATINWGDDASTETEGVISDGTITGSFTYTEAGVYTVTVTVVDETGGSDSSTAYAAVYDPDAYSFVSGAGWYDEPLAPRGKAFFGLFVRQWGECGPYGRLRVRWGENRFRATSIDWLVVEADGSAWFAGYGTINDSVDHYFMVELGDDSIWITIFDEYDTGGLVDLIRGRIRIRTYTP